MLSISARAIQILFILFPPWFSCLITCPFIPYQIKPQRLQDKTAVLMQNAVAFCDAPPPFVNRFRVIYQCDISVAIKQLLFDFTIFMPDINISLTS
jgi:hypothetical protein